MGEVSLNTLGSMSEYDTYVLQGNSTQNSLAIQWPFSRRRVPLQENSWQDFFAVLAKIYQRCAAFATRRATRRRNASRRLPLLVMQLHVIHAAVCAMTASIERMHERCLPTVRRGCPWAPAAWYRHGVHTLGSHGGNTVQHSAWCRRASASDLALLTVLDPACPC